MGFEKRVPASISELKGYLDQVHENRKHVSSVKVGTSGDRIEIDLSRMANFAGHPDMYMPLKRGKQEEARVLLERLLSRSQQGYAPSDSDASALFDLIDPMGR